MAGCLPVGRQGAAWDTSVLYSRGVGFEVAVTEVVEGAGVAGPGHFSGRGRHSNPYIFQS